MRNLGKIQVIYVIALASIALGALISLVIFKESESRGIGLHKSSQEDFQITASFQNGKLIVSITNMGSMEVDVQMIFLEGKNYIDFDASINAAIKPGETVRVQTNIMQPKSGTYNVKVKLSNGLTISCKVIAD